MEIPRITEHGLGFSVRVHLQRPSRSACRASPSYQKVRGMSEHVASKAPQFTHQVKCRPFYPLRWGNAAWRSKLHCTSLYNWEGDQEGMEETRKVPGTGRTMNLSCDCIGNESRKICILQDTVRSCPLIDYLTSSGFSEGPRVQCNPDALGRRSRSCHSTRWLCGISVVST